MMGTDDPGIPQDGEGPQRRVRLDPFYIEEHEVTNKQFQHFTNQTGYITEVQSHWQKCFFFFNPITILSPIVLPIHLLLPLSKLFWSVLQSSKSKCLY